MILLTFSKDLPGCVVMKDWVRAKGKRGDYEESMAETEESGSKTEK